MTGYVLCDENTVFVKECVGLSFLVYCSPILVWEELRFRNKPVEDYAEMVGCCVSVKVACLTRFRIDEAYFRLGFGCVWRFIWETPAADREISGVEVALTQNPF